MFIIERQKFIWVTLKVMSIKVFANIEIYRPSNLSEARIRNESEAHLRSKFNVGLYSEAKDINNILQHQFEFYSKKFKHIIPKLASRNFIEFVLWQFDQASIIEQKYKVNQLSNWEKSQWKELGSIFRRATKYLAESIVLLQPKETPHNSNENLRILTDEIWIAAEEMVRLYLLSDQTFMVFPETTTLEIYSEGSKDIWNLEVSQNCNIEELVRSDTAKRSSVIGKDQSFVNNISIHEQTIGEALKQSIGASFDEAVSLLSLIIQKSEADTNSFSIPFLHYSQLIDTLHKHTKLKKEAIEIILRSFTISKNNLELEGREVWKPKQEHRSFRRGFFEMPHPTGTHLVFSKQMALESLNQLIHGLVFRQFPSEWKNHEVNAAVVNLSQQAGKWFEHTVKNSLQEIGIIGLQSINKQIGLNNHVIKIPSEVGEIDFLGFSQKEKLLLIAECKMVQGGFEGKFFRDDIKEFITSNKAYVKKYTQKVQWVKANISSIVNALNSTELYSTPINPVAIATAIITFYPTVAQYFIDEYPCVSITNLILDYREKNKWSYDRGVYLIKI